MKVLLVGAGPMAVAYGQVLNALGVAWAAIGRGAASAAAFEAAIGKKPVGGGFAAYLQSQPELSGVAVIVALPIPQLLNAAKAFVGAGARRILLEIPGGLDAAEIAEAAQIAARSGAQIFVAYNRRFYASVAAARVLVAEDGGVTSFHFDFTEFVSRIVSLPKDPVVLRHWFLANSSHVVDTAFNLCGNAAAFAGITAGSLDWHPSGAIFAGHGRTAAGAVFTWHADWTSAGRWGIDVRTPRRRLIFQPLEKLAVQEKAGFELSQVAIADELDRRFKPGLYRQIEALLSDNPSATPLAAIAAHAENVRRWCSTICAQAETLSRPAE